MWCKIGVQSCSFACGCAVFPTPFVKETVLFHCMAPAPISEIVWSYTGVYLWAVLSDPLRCFVFVGNTPFCYRSLVCVFEIRKCESFNFALFKLTLAIWTPLSLHCRCCFRFSCIHSFGRGTDIKRYTHQGSHVWDTDILLFLALKPPLQIWCLYGISRNRTKALISHISYPLCVRFVFINLECRSP